MDAANLLFLINVAWLTAHELDAIQQHEWRFFPFLASFGDVTAYRIFTFLHVPLLVLIMINWQAREFQIGFNLFLLIHAALHWLLRNHPKLTFNNWFSALLIYGAVPLAVLHLFLIR
ncbi:MAG: hypothetical protein DYG88_13665 [Chloroflexi bacterium CFX4]|nr:hypothetical protein [Chloroflexi bacterium CFX4]MDL1923580.1 hypothetical protein [Chloroflexi bacterium CFX3]